MKKYIFSLIFFSIICPAFAETYIIDKGDGSVAVIEYVYGSNDSLSDVIDELGYSGNIPVQINKEDLPSREDRKYWKKVGNSVFVDGVAKQADIDAKAQKEAEKALVFEKLKITEEEFEKIKD